MGTNIEDRKTMVSSPALSSIWRELSPSEGWRVQDGVQLLNTLHTRRVTHMIARSFSLSLSDKRTEPTLSPQFPGGNRKYTNILSRQREKKTAPHTDSSHTIHSRSYFVLLRSVVEGGICFLSQLHNVKWVNGLIVKVKTIP